MRACYGPVFEMVIKYEYNDTLLFRYCLVQLFQIIYQDLTLISMTMLKIYIDLFYN